MKIALKLTFQDEKGSLEMILSEYPNITCDGQYLIFTDDDGEDHKVSTADVFDITAVMLDI